MKLRAYLDQEKITPADFAKRLNERGLDVSEFGVRKWATGERIPRRDAMVAIQEETQGQVTPDDFFDTPSASSPAGAIAQ